ncbi:MAG TPA: DNA replication/repair protein RecF [Bacteroidia bacterium]|nr:DNA replication/repair protein RecF [Bacteroidia bacterium]
MYLKQLSIINFKNYAEATVQFHPKLNCFTGVNGMGKTNLLDAIYYLSFCKSYSNTIDSQNILFDQDFFMLQGLFDTGIEIDEVYCGIKRAQKKVFKRNKKEYEKLSDHIGLFPLVMISPADTNLITGGSDQRRRFIDGIISQFDKLYLDNLVHYNHILQQRNALLKHFSITRSFDSVGLEVWDEQLVTYGSYIHDAREVFLKEFISVFEKYYALIAENNEQVHLKYVSTIQQDYKAALQAAIKKDCALEHTSVGVHRDDLDFLLSENPIKKFASQGQQKTYLLALKLAQYEFIKNKKGVKPLLLLDDIHDKLDAHRFKKLIDIVSSNEFGQIFITDTHTERMQQLFAHTTDRKIFKVENAMISEIE